MKIQDITKTETGYRVQLSDKSFWACDANGENWVQEAIGVDELQDKFDAFWASK